MSPLYTVDGISNDIDGIDNQYQQGWDDTQHVVVASH